MKKLKRCALLFLLSLLVLTVGAAACEGGACLQKMELICIGEEPVEWDEEVSLLAGDVEGAEAALVAGMRERQDSINIRDYQITVQEFDAIWQRVLLSNPELFMLNGYCRYSSSQGKMVTVLPEYTMSVEEYAAARVVYEDGVAAIVEQVDPNWSELEQVLFIHDYLASHFEYDLSYSIYDAYQFLVYGKGVCESYTKVFMAVARELGIDVSYVRSTNLNHAWNLVEVDGNWYHLDVTHDDPIADRLGYARHTYFLLSDVASIGLRKASWENSHPDETWTLDWIYGNGQRAADTSYDEAFWRDTVSPFRNVDGVWYAVTGEGLKTWDGASAEFGETVDAFDSPSSGLALYHGRLYYNSYYGVRCYEPFAGHKGEVLNFAKTHGGRYYGQGLVVEGDTLTYEAYWFDDKDVYHVGSADMQLQAYTSAANGSFGYYLEDGRLYVEAPSARVAAVFYDENNRMTGAALLTGTASCGLQEGRAKLFAITADDNWMPCGEAVSGTVH